VDATPDTEATSDRSAEKTVRSVNMAMLEVVSEFGGTDNARLKAATTAGVATVEGLAADVAEAECCVRPTAKPMMSATILAESSSIR
jgi:hypothetical protein